MATLTDGDRKILNMAWHCFKSLPEVDYKKLQEVGGYKTAASATACYLSARKKILQSESAKLTDGESKILSMAWQCFKTMPQVEYKKLQEKGGYKSMASATAVYLSARKKFVALAGEDGVVNVGKKRKKADSNEDKGEKPKKRTKMVDTKVKAEESDGTKDNAGMAKGAKKRMDKTNARQNVNSQDTVEAWVDGHIEPKKASDHEADDDRVVVDVLTGAAQLLQDMNREGAEE